jgi:hypothetical protein
MGTQSPINILLRILQFTEQYKFRLERTIYIQNLYLYIYTGPGARGGVVVEALRYKP